MTLSGRLEFELVEVLTVKLKDSSLLIPLLLKQCHNFHS